MNSPTPYNSAILENQNSKIDETIGEIMSTIKSIQAAHKPAPPPHSSSPPPQFHLQLPPPSTIAITQPQSPPTPTQAAPPLKPPSLPKITSLPHLQYMSLPHLNNPTIADDTIVIPAPVQKKIPIHSPSTIVTPVPDSGGKDDRSDETKSGGGEDSSPSPLLFASKFDKEIGIDDISVFSDVIGDSVGLDSVFMVRLMPLATSKLLQLGIGLGDLLKLKITFYLLNKALKVFDQKFMKKEFGKCSTVLIDSFFIMEYVDCVKMFDVYPSAAKQIDVLVGFYNWCKDAIRIGIGKCNECREIVQRYVMEWEKTVQRRGRWVDFQNSFNVKFRDANHSRKSMIVSVIKRLSHLTPHTAEDSRKIGCTQSFKEPSQFAWSNYHEAHFLVPCHNDCFAKVSEWISERGNTLINFWVYSSKRTIFLKLVDVSNIRYYVESIYEFLNEVLEEGMIRNMLQLVTNNDERYVFLVQRLGDTYCSISWTPGAFNVVDLLLEDTEKHSYFVHLIAELIEIAAHYVVGEAGVWKKKLTPQCVELFAILPLDIQEQVLVEKAPHGYVQVPKIDNQKKLILMVEIELQQRKRADECKGQFKGQLDFNHVDHWNTMVYRLAIHCLGDLEVDLVGSSILNDLPVEEVFKMATSNQINIQIVVLVWLKPPWPPPRRIH